MQFQSAQWRMSRAHVCRSAVAVARVSVLRAAKCIVDSFRRGSVLRFASHSCNPNATFWKGRNGDRYAFGVELLQAVLQGQEITIDYGPDWFDADADCYCYEANCRWPPNRPKRRRQGDQSGRASKHSKIGTTHDFMARLALCSMY